MTPKPRTPKPEALPAPYPDVEPGDHVYVRHPERGPMAVRVLATGKHGLTATCPMGDLYRVHWERILGVKSRMNRKFRLVDNGAEGCILEDDQGQRRYVAHAEDDDEERDGKPLRKSQPTPAQIEAGNYKKRHIRFQGLEISIENPSGSVRKGVDRDGHEWRTKMTHAYGYIRGSKGVDKDHVDCYIGPNPDASHAYIVHQRKAGQWDRYDEDKVMLGFDTEAQARAAYLKHYDDPRFLGPVTAMPMDEFKRKVMATANSPKIIKAFPDHERALFLKAHIKAHTRRLASGKVAAVRAHTDRRRDRDEQTGDLFAEAAANEHRNIIRARIIAGQGVPEDDLKSHGLDQPDAMAALLVPQHLGELPIKAVIARGKAIADELVQNFSRTLAAISLQNLENQKREGELASLRSGITRQITTLAQNLNALKSAYLDPDTGEWKPEHITGKELAQKTISEIESQIENLLEEKRRIIDEQKELVKESSGNPLLTLAEALIKAMQAKAAMARDGATVEQEIERKHINIGGGKSPLLDPMRNLTKRYVTDALAAFTSLFGIEHCVIQNIVSIKNKRAHYTRRASDGPCINIGTHKSKEGIKRALFHELGHAMQSHYNYEACKKFIISRRKSDRPQPLGGSYEAWEMGFDGQFVDRYVGKDWSIQGDTEVLSMGMERFVDSEKLAAFMAQDHEHFYLVLACAPALRAYTDIRDESQGVVATMTQE